MGRRQPRRPATGLPQRGHSQPHLHRIAGAMMRQACQAESRPPTPSSSQSPRPPPISLPNQHRNPRHHPTSPSLGNTDPRSSRNPQRITGISSNPGCHSIIGKPRWVADLSGRGRTSRTTQGTSDPRHAPHVRCAADRTRSPPQSRTTPPRPLIDHRHHGPLRTPLPIRNRRPRRRTRPGTRPSRDGPNTDKTQIRRHRPRRPIGRIPRRGSPPTPALRAAVPSPQLCWGD
jgi:hypothetical protein